MENLRFLRAVGNLDVSICESLSPYIDSSKALMNPEADSLIIKFELLI